MPPTCRPSRSTALLTRHLRAPLPSPPHRPRSRPCTRNAAHVNVRPSARAGTRHSLHRRGPAVARCYPRSRACVHMLGSRPLGHPTGVAGRYAVRAVHPSGRRGVLLLRNGAEGTIPYTSKITANINATYIRLGLCSNRLSRRRGRCHSPTTTPINILLHQQQQPPSRARKANVCDH